MARIFDDNPLSIGGTPLVRLNRIAAGLPVSQSKPRGRWRRLAHKLREIRRGLELVPDDVSFVVEIDGPEFSCTFPVNDGQIVVGKCRTVLCGRILRVVFPNHNLLLQVRLKGEVPGAFAWISTTLAHPISDQEA